MCPIETPEGPNIGLIGSLSTFGRINPFGFVETPYRKVEAGKVTDRIEYLTADEETASSSPRPTRASARTAPSPRTGCSPATARVRPTWSSPPRSTTWTFSPRQMVSVATALIPFLEHDDTPTARSWGSNMQRQAVPLIQSQSPLVGTGMEFRAAVDAGDVVSADQPGASPPSRRTPSRS